MDTSLFICEIYRTIQGESSFAGLPCVIVRLAGCNLSCRYCDTPYARAGGTEMTVEDVLKKVGELGTAFVGVTGGEPLLQEGTPALLKGLLAMGAKVTLETNGTLPLDPVPGGVIRIIDIKCPGSGELGRNRWENMDLLAEGDQVKFVLCERADYDWAKGVIHEHGLDRFEVLLSPAWDMLEPRRLAEWMLEDGLKARLNLQLHRVVWPEGEPR
jgi:7-carboxy-7-deazaguanine synthase